MFLMSSSYLEPTHYDDLDAVLDMQYFSTRAQIRMAAITADADSHTLSVSDGQNPTGNEGALVILRPDYQRALRIVNFTPSQQRLLDSGPKWLLLRAGHGKNPSHPGKNLLALARTLQKA